jgi:predicted Zn-dependent protease
VATTSPILRYHFGIWGRVAQAVFVGMFLSCLGCERYISEGHNRDGVQLYQQTRFQDAIQQFNEATYADPTDADSYYNLAFTYYELGKKDRNPAYIRLAEENYHKCLDRNSNHTDCYRGLAVLLSQQGRDKEAFSLLQGWADRQPTLADPKVELARLYTEFGKRQMAENCLFEAIEAQPNNPRAFAALGKLREDAGDRPQALANYQRSLEYNSDQPQLAARVSALQIGANVNGSPTPAPPSVELGKEMIADRDRDKRVR